MTAFIIEDGYSLEKNFAAKPGLYPALRVQFRPSLERKRFEYFKHFGAGGTLSDVLDITRHEEFVTNLIAEHIIEVNGQKLDKDKIRRIVPDVRYLLANLVIGQIPADEPCDVSAEQKN